MSSASDPVLPAGGPGSAAGRRSFRDRVDDHPIGLLLGVAVAAITATLAVVVPIVQLTQDSRVAALEAQAEQVRVELGGELERERSARAAEVENLTARLGVQQREAEQALSEAQASAAAREDELTRSISSIRRSLGSDTQYFDVASLVTTREEAASLPEDARFFPQEHWYALDPAQHPGWSQDVVTELQMSADLLGMDVDALRARMTDVQAAAQTRFPVYLWRYGEDRAVTFRDPGSAQELTIHPRTEVSVQRVAIDDYVSGLAEASGLTEAQTELVRENLQRDPAGWVLQDQLAVEIGGSSLGLRARIDTLQKRDSVAYARVETTLPDATVDGQAYDEYYWTREWLLIGTADDLFLVKLFVADDDHRSPDFAAVSAWLDRFRVLSS